MDQTVIEICCASAEDARAAYEGGADRIELNCALECGGLTPSVGCLKEAVRQVKIPVIAMIRPRTGGFCYTDAEFRSMCEDAKAVLENGAAGIAVGILRPDRTVDLDRMDVLRQICQSYEKEIVCHRAIDIAADMVNEALKLSELQFDRILTSGGRQKCMDGVAAINKMIEVCGEKIQILACGGIRMDNLREIMQKTRCSQFHMALMKKACDGTMSDSRIQFNGVLSENTYQVTDKDQVVSVVRLK